MPTRAVEESPRRSARAPALSALWALLPVAASAQEPAPQTCGQVIQAALEASQAVAAARAELAAQLTSERATAALAVAAPGNGALLVSSFGPFKPFVRFYADEKYFYAESDSMPNPALTAKPKKQRCT